MTDLLTGHEPPVTKREMVLCVKREIGYRERIYPRWVESGKMKLDHAEYQIRTMKAVLKLVEKS